MTRISSSRPGIRRGAPGWALVAACLLSLPLAAQDEAAGSSVPFSKAWNIASSGKAASSGQLLFRVTPGDGEDPVEVTVFVLSGANETGVASSIRRALSTQLDASSYDVEAGQGANVLITVEESAAAGQASQGFSLELVDSDVDNVRVMVQNAAPVAPPTVPSRSVPANPPNPAVPGNPATPGAPGDASSQQDPQAPANPGSPAAAPDAPTSPGPSAPAPQSPASPPPQTPAPSSPASPAPAPGADGGAGAPASAPPPPGGSPGGSAQ